jgi:hypothetical protein
MKLLGAWPFRQGSRAVPPTAIQPWLNGVLVSTSWSRGLYLHNAEDGWTTGEDAMITLPLNDSYSKLEQPSIYGLLSWQGRLLTADFTRRILDTQAMAEWPGYEASDLPFRPKRLSEGTMGSLRCVDFDQNLWESAAWGAPWTQIAEGVTDAQGDWVAGILGGINLLHPDRFFSDLLELNGILYGLQANPGKKLVAMDPEDSLNVLEELDFGFVIDTCMGTDGTVIYVGDSFQMQILRVDPVIGSSATTPPPSEGSVIEVDPGEVVTVKGKGKKK